ncbi:MAG TPA: hypothetical protein VIO14_06770 [Dehalococcoidia bacterium]
MGVVGYGVVGQATAHLFGGAAVYDPAKGFDDPAVLADCPVIFLCVPTPTVHGRNDLSLLHHALAALAPVLREGQVLAVRSTVLPGTMRALGARYPRLRFAANPEFLRSHRAFQDALRPYRTVVGADDPGTAEAVVRAYRARLPADTPFVVTDSVSAELIKYAANAFLATKIAYAHEVWAAAQRLGADYGAVSTALGLDPRIGAGEELVVDPDDPGFSDECLPKDLAAFVTFLAELGLPARLPRAAGAVNDAVRGRQDPLAGVGEEG